MNEAAIGGGLVLGDGFIWGESFCHFYTKVLLFLKY